MFKRKFTLEHTCVDLPQEDVESLRDMVEQGREITFSTFARHVDWQDVATSLGYIVRRGRGVYLKDEPYAYFYRSTWKGIPCYYMQHSAIEYIFLKLN